MVSGAGVAQRYCPVAGAETRNVLGGISLAVSAAAIVEMASGGASAAVATTAAPVLAGGNGVMYRGRG